MSSPLVNLMPTAFRLEWCDRCLTTHGFADIVTLAQDGVSMIGQWSDHKDVEDWECIT